MRDHGRFRCVCFVLLSLLLAGCGADIDYETAERPNLPVTRDAFEAPVQMANRDIAREFVSLVFEPENAGKLTGLLKFEPPITVAFASASLDPYKADLKDLIVRMRREADLDIRMIADAGSADIQISRAPRRLVDRYFPNVQCFLIPERLSFRQFIARLDSGRLTEWSELTRREGATVFLPSSAKPHEIRECLQEEIAQSLGPANDLFHLPDSVFNDDNVHTSLTSFDMLVLRTLYDPRLKMGMSRRAAMSAALDVLNEINPRGRNRSPSPRRADPRWNAALNDAFAPEVSDAVRDAALERALLLARRLPKPDHRLAHTLSVLAAIDIRNRPPLAEGHLQTALASLRIGYPDDDLRVATLKLYLAQTKLALDKPEEALTLVDAALPSLAAHDAELRIATALKVKSTALRDLGRGEMAVAVGMDSLRWARYALGANFGGLEEAQRLLEVAQSRLRGG